MVCAKVWLKGFCSFSTNKWRTCMCTNDEGLAAFEHRGVCWWACGEGAGGCSCPHLHQLCRCHQQKRASSDKRLNSYSHNEHDQKFWFGPGRLCGRFAVWFPAFPTVLVLNPLKVWLEVIGWMMSAARKCFECSELSRKSTAWGLVQLRGPKNFVLVLKACLVHRDENKMIKHEI